MCKKTKNYQFIGEKSTKGGSIPRFVRQRVLFQLPSITFVIGKRFVSLICYLFGKIVPFRRKLDIDYRSVRRCALLRSDREPQFHS
jgi:hypothetical protein